MKRNNGYLELSFDSDFNSLVINDIITPIKRNKTCFYINSLGLFFKEEINTYKELIGSKIAKLLDIKSVDYDMLSFITNDKNYKGVISPDFRIKDYQLVNMSEILTDYLEEQQTEILFNEMNLELINKAIEFRYSNYKNSNKIVENIMHNLKICFLFDMLIGNIDNGKYNYEIMESSNNAYVTPYFDYEEIFKFSSTRFTVSDSNNYDIYDNLYIFLNNENNYITIFNKMYNLLTPEILENIIKEVENDINYKIDTNTKNIIFLSYYRHYTKIGEVLNRLSKTNSIKK